MNPTTQPSAATPSNGRRVTVLGAVVDLSLGLLKGIVGVVAGSSVMVADAVHSLTDFGSDVVTLVALRAAAKPADKEHPYGHGSFETIGTVILAGLLLAAVGGILYDAYGRLGDATVPGSLALWAAAISVAVKEVLYQVSAKVARKLGSPLLLANAWHHRSDALSSVAAFAGIAGARLGYPVFDPIAAILIALLVGHVGIKLLSQVFREFTVGALPGEVLERMRVGITGLSGVVNVHELRARRMGSSILVDLHVQVDEATTVSDGHQVAERVRKFVFDENTEVTEVLVHIDPEEDEHVPPGLMLAPPREIIERQVRTIVGAQSEVRAVSHVHFHFLRGGIFVVVNIVLDPELTIRAAEAVARDLRAALEALPEIDHADIHLELDDHAHG